MITFKEYEKRDIEESLWASIKSVFSSIKSLVLKLKFGEKHVVSFKKLLGEDYLVEGWLTTMMGGLAEVTTVYHLLERMKSSGMRVDSKSVTESKKTYENYKKELKRQIKDGVSSAGKEIPQNERESASNQFDDQIERGIALSDRVFLELIKSQDAMVCEYSVINTAHSESKISTADLVIKKMTESEIIEEVRYSLKAYATTAGETSTTKGTSRDPFGFLGMSLGFDQVTTNSLNKLSASTEQVVRAYGRQIPQYAKFNKEITKWVVDEEKKLKATAKWKKAKKGEARAEAKRRCAKKFGREIRDYHLNLWMKIFELGMKKNSGDFKKAVLRAMDLSPSSPILLTAHHDKKGRVNTYLRGPKTVSGDLKKLFEAQLKDIEIKIEAKTVPTPSNLSQLVKQKKLRQGPVFMVFFVSGVEVYRVYGEVKNSILLQMSAAGVGGRVSGQSVKFEINEYLDSIA